MPYADYEQDLMSYFAEKVVEWKTAIEGPIDIPVAWYNEILESDEYERTEPYIVFNIVEATHSQPTIGRDPGAIYKRIEGQLVIDAFYPIGYSQPDIFNITSKIMEAVEQVRIAGHTLTKTGIIINRHPLRGMRAKRCYVKFETNLVK